MPKGYKWSQTDQRWIRHEEKTEIKFEERDDGESWAILISLWRWYPDYLLDLLEDDGADFSLALIQRVIIRANARYRNVFVTGSRGTSKTYCSTCSKYTDGVLWPGEVMRYFGPSVKQLLPLAKQARRQIEKNYPALTGHYYIAYESGEKFEVRTGHGSVFSVEAMRGDNAHAVLAEEVGQEEKGKAFDHDTFSSVVLPAIRLTHRVGKQRDPLHIDFKKSYITSACSQHNQAYQYRLDALTDMVLDGTGFAVDLPYQAALLSGIRDWDWAQDLRKKLSPEEWLREMESIYTGFTENPVISENVLTEAKKLTVMETHHCGDPEAVYVVAYDVSYEDGAKNAKCAVSVMKLTRQKSFIKHGTYLKQLVYLEDMPPREHMLQALYLKRKWLDYCMDGGAGTYLVIDGWQYGKAVVEDLMKDLKDGLPPLCCCEHRFYTDLELPGALPVIYAIKATPGYEGGHDPDGEMLRYAGLQFENGNVQLLTTDVYTGVEAYKKFHGIKDGMDDAKIAVPYAKTREMIEQIQNLKKELSGTQWREKRISKSINRDMWSATKYALRMAQVLEYKLRKEEAKQKSSWAETIQRAQARRAELLRRNAAGGGRTVGYRGGRLR